MGVVQETLSLCLKNNNKTYEKRTVRGRLREAQESRPGTMLKKTSKETLLEEKENSEEKKEKKQEVSAPVTHFVIPSYINSNNSLKKMSLKKHKKEQ